MAPSMRLQIAILIMTLYSAVVIVDVECIRNGGSTEQNNSDSSSSSTSATPSDFFPSQQLPDVLETRMPAARQSQTQSQAQFQPSSQLISFTSSDVSSANFAATHPNNANYATQSQKLEKRYSTQTTDQQFAFPSEQQQQPQSSSSFNKYNYNINTQPNILTASTIPTQLQTSPIHTYRDPYTNKNHQYTPSEQQEYTVHSSLQVQNHRYDGPYAPSYLRETEPPQYSSPQHTSYPSQFSTSPAHYPTASAQFSSPSQHSSPSHYSSPPHYSAAYTEPDYTHKYDRPHYQHPNAIPSNDRVLPGPPQRPSLASPTTDPPTAPPTRLSYDSKDYPPPSYFQHSNYAPQRQESSNSKLYHSVPTATSSSSSSSSYPNYANNNLGNYLQGEQHYPQRKQQESVNYDTRPPSYTNAHYSPTPPTQYQQQNGPPARPPSYNNYYDYQQGEIPPPNYRPPYRPNAPAPAPVSGLASLASLFTATQQYAPQFSNLLLGGAAGGGNANALGSLLGAFTGAPAAAPGGGGVGNGGIGSRPINMQLIKALENIARNDDLQCVPKVLCQMIAGQTQRGQLPTFVTSPAITNFLAAFPTSSPALIYGRAALLGISGGVRSCVQTYLKCPKNEDEIIYYLNNHRGGFFKFFSEPVPEPQQPSAPATASSGSSSLFSILSALTGNPAPLPPPTTPRPTRRPTVAPSTDIAGTIGNWFTNLLSENTGGIEYQRRRRRSRRALNAKDTEIERAFETETKMKDFDDAEDEEDTRNADDDEIVHDDDEYDGDAQYDGVEGRILHKELQRKGPKFFPDNELKKHADELRNSINEFNKAAAGRKLKFPSVSTTRYYVDARELENETEVEDDEGNSAVYFKNNDDKPEVTNGQHISFMDSAEDNADDSRSGKKVRFQEDDDQQGAHSSLSHSIALRGGRMIFPDELPKGLIRKGRIINRPTAFEGYAPQQTKDDDRFVLSNSNRQYSESSSNSVYTTYTKSISNRYQKYPNTNNNNYAASSSYNYPTQRTTRRPYKDDENVYVNNSHGMTEYYITPDGRKVYL